MSSSDVSGETGGAESALGVDMNLEVVTLPVADVDRSKAFYESLGWRLDIDLVVSEAVRSVQFTPPHSGCSIQFGKGRTAAEPGSAQAMILVVEDIDAARGDLIDRGVDVSEVQEMKPPGLRRARALVLRPRIVQRSGWQRLGAAGDHHAAARPDLGGVTWMSPRWQICCTRPPSVTARSRRSLHRTTGGTGTRPTCMPARAGAPQTKRRRPRGATWRRPSTLW